jgi:hypothetical protein
MFRYSKKYVVVFVLGLFFLNDVPVFSQELFPMNEPASNIPKGVLGVRAFDNTFKEVNQVRNLMGIRLMYGVLPKLSVMATVSVSNHHDKNFPMGLATHTHDGNQTTYSTGSIQRGVAYPYLFTGVYLFAKYRFLTLDGEHKHFRMAAYADWSNVKAAHDEAEPNLLDDTKGYGGGLISTYLKNHFAVSLTTGFIIPKSYNGLSPDNNGGPMIPTEVIYGRAIKYNLSFGYLLFPKTYKNYNQANWNIYLELMGKSYEAAKINQYGGVVSLPISTASLQAGNYLDVCPGLQYIYKSNLRVDFSVEFPFINKSYAHLYPVYMIGIQRYFYL